MGCLFIGASVEISFVELLVRADDCIMGGEGQCDVEEDSMDVRFGDACIVIVLHRCNESMLVWLEFVLATKGGVVKLSLEVCIY